MLQLLIGFLLSFIGSLPLGMINMSVADTTIRKGLRAGMWMGAGAALVELLQALCAILFADVLVNNAAIDEAIRWISMGVFFVLGIYFLLKAPAQPELKATRDEQAAVKDFIKGAGISSLNVLAFPYWIFYGTYLNAEGWLTGWGEDAFFLIGIFLGTFALLYVYARLSLTLMSKMGQIARRIDQIIGLVFLVLACLQLWSVWGN